MWTHRGCGLIGVWTHRGCGLTRRDMASLEGVWPPWRGRLIGCVDVCICRACIETVCVHVCLCLYLTAYLYILYICVSACVVLLNSFTHSGSRASCLCEEEEVLDWFHDLNAMKYCKQFVEKVPRCNYTCVCAHAHTQHTHGTILIQAQQHIHTTCVMLRLCRLQSTE